MSTCPFLSACGRQKSADGRIQVRRCRKSRKQSHRLFGTQGTQKRARTETFPGLAKLSLRGICPLGCVMEIARNPEKSGSTCKKKTVFLGKEISCSTTCKFFPFAGRKRKREEGMELRQCFSTLDEGLLKSCLYHFCQSVMYFSAQGMCPCLVGCLPERN